MVKRAAVNTPACSIKPLTKLCKFGNKHVSSHTSFSDWECRNWAPLLRRLKAAWGNGKIQRIFQSAKQKGSRRETKEVQLEATETLKSLLLFTLLHWHQWGLATRPVLPGALLLRRHLRLALRRTLAPLWRWSIWSASRRSWWWKH